MELHGGGDGERQLAGLCVCARERERERREKETLADGYSSKMLHEVHFPNACTRAPTILHTCFYLHPQISVAHANSRLDPPRLATQYTQTLRDRESFRCRSGGGACASG